MKKKTLAFMRGAISTEEYMEHCKVDNFSFLQSLVEEGAVTTRAIRHTNGTIELVRIPYSAKEVLSEIYRRKTVAAAVDLFSEICRLMKNAFPNEEFETDFSLLKAFEYLLSNTPDYIGGYEAESVLLSVYHSLAHPDTAAGKKEYKQAVKQLFKYKDKKPSWIQEPEWPVCNDTPLTFLEERKNNKGEKHYLFLNEETNETVEIVQFL